MTRTPFSPSSRFWLILPLLALIGVLLACTQSAPNSSAPWSVSAPGTALPIVQPTSAVYVPMASRPPGTTPQPPTPDPPHLLPKLRTDPIEYTVQSGDTLGRIAQNYGVSLEMLIAANDLANPNILSVGQVVIVPPPTPAPAGPNFKIIPDAELVYGPTSVGFDVGDFVKSRSGYLLNYTEEVEDFGGRTLSGVQIVERIAEQFSVNPRLLLAALEYQSGWVTLANPDEATRDYPMGIEESNRKGLYRQLAWAANNLNRGFYLWRVGGIGAWVLFDGAVAPIDPTLNAGTAGVQQMFARLYGRADWERAITAEGLYATYGDLFGYPFDRTYEPLVPMWIAQPHMQLPFEPGVVWAFTGGPHGGWGDGSAWAALDFAPSGEALGCVQSDAWIVAAADGLVIRAEDGEVLQDLDGDGQEQTGWTLLYMHIEARERVAVGTYVRAGERIGHASCEGGFSTGTHVHLARRYNGEWIPADQTLPFVLDGWISRGAGAEYDGFLEKEGESIEAWNGISAENSIQR
jgi:murein DD-endopeptidase MepM/ murein hydrolase activator NlpD